MKVSKSIPMAIILISAFCALFSSCGAKEDYKYLVGFSQCNLAEPWRQTMNAAVEKEALNHLDMKIIYADAHQDNDEQVSQIRSFLTQKIDLLLVSPNEAAPLTPVIEEVYSAGIPVDSLSTALLWGILTHASLEAIIKKSVEWRALSSPKRSMAKGISLR